MSSIPQNTALLHSMISAGLSDSDIKQAVLNYLKAETERIKPKEEWREVWFQVSADTRVYTQPGIDQRTGISDYQHEVKLRLHVEYNESRSTAVIVGTMISANSPYLDPGYFSDFMHKWQSRKSIDVLDYAVAIVAGQNAWTEAYDWFVEQTEAVSDE
jgi:hypothetical protein